MKNEQTLVTEVLIANRNQEVIFKLLEHLEPAFSLVAAVELSGISTAHIQNLHVILLQHFKSSANNYIN